MTTQNLLVELFVEELPPKALQKLGDAFAGVLFDQLQAQGLTGDDSGVTAYASPRRLAAHVRHVWLKAEDKAVRQKLMPVAVGLTPEGQPTPALLKKLQALGADLSDPARREDRLCELNVIHQVHNVCHSPFVRAAWERGQSLAVHGWMYALSDGLLQDMNVCITGPHELPDA